MSRIGSKIVSFGFFCGLVLLSFGQGAMAESVNRHITMTGQGSVSAVPDRVEINLGVTSKAATARDALTLNNVNMKAVLDALKSGGVEKKYIQTSNFSIQPDYEHFRDGRPPKIRGYSVSNTVRIQLNEISKLGELLDKVVSSGSNQIHGIRFYVSKADKLKDEARKKAIKNAARKANLYADAAGVQLGKPISIIEGSHGSRPPGPLARTLNAQANAVPIAQGEQQLNVAVTVTWSLD